MNNPTSHSDAGVHVTLDELLALSALARGSSLAEVRRSAAARTGSHVSKWRGRGVDFRESRIYQAGDDIRHMDWRVTARSGSPHTKLFEEEREHGLLLMIDFNPAMRFGTRVRFKSVQAARIAGLLAWMAIASGDRVGAIGFGGGIEHEIKPASGRRGVLNVVRALRDWDQEAGSQQESLRSSLERARRILRPGTRLIVITDGFSADETAWPVLARCAGRHELGCILVTDALELAAPPPGRYTISSSGTRRTLDFGDRKLSASWPLSFAAARERVRSEFTRLGAKVVEASTDADVRKVILPFTQRAPVARDSSA
jgi:uncharacterized protein (DUF58 family)